MSHGSENYFLWSKGLWDLWCSLMWCSADHLDPTAEESSSLSSPDSYSSFTAWKNGLGLTATLLSLPTCSSWFAFLLYPKLDGLSLLCKLFIGIISCVSRFTWSESVRKCGLNIMDRTSDSLLSLSRKRWQRKERT